MRKQRTIFLIISVLAFLGSLVSAYLVNLHFSPSEHAFCNINDYFNCDLVNKSSYAVFLGIPVAILGLLAYLTLFVFSIMAYRGRAVAWIVTYMSIFSLGGLIFSFYLTYVELFIIEAICIFCVIQQIIIFLITLFYLYLWTQRKKLL